MLEAELRRKVDALWDKFWSGGLANPLMAIDQMNYLIFLKQLEDSDNLEAQRAKVRGVKHRSLFKNAEKCRWSYWRNLNAEEMLHHIQTVVFPWLKGLAPDNHAFTSYMKDAAFLIPKASLLVEAVNVIDELAITDRNVDTQGDIYEHMLGKLGVAGQIGQFRTPRHIIRLMACLVDPKIGETVLDPACGTAGFLIAAYQHMIESGTSPQFLTYDDTGRPSGLLGDRLSRKQWDWLKNASLIGYDFDPSMVRIAAMNMVLHGIEHPKVAYADALGKGFSHTPRAQVLLANPPFSGSIDPSDIHDDFRIKTKKTELLFVSLMEDLLIPGGRAAVVVPDGVLFGTATKAHHAIRKRLVEDNCIEAVISLPAGVFRPYSGVSTGIIFFRKGGHTDSVWMYDLTADGFSLDDKRVPVDENDILDLLSRWPGRAAGPHSFIVSKEEIRDSGYDLLVSQYQAKPAGPSREELDAAVAAALEEVESAQRAYQLTADTLATRLRDSGYA